MTHFGEVFAFLFGLLQDRCNFPIPLLTCACPPACSPCCDWSTKVDGGSQIIVSVDVQGAQLSTAPQLRESKISLHGLIGMKRTVDASHWVFSSVSPVSVCVAEGCFFFCFFFPFRVLTSHAD
jgi:hypothetical protein